MPKKIKPSDWNLDKARDLYHIKGWGNDYFDINAQGEIAVNFPNTKGDKISVSLMDVINGVETRGKPMPLLLRVQNLFEQQIRLLNETFRLAIKNSNYQGEYRGVFPIKVNQQAHVIDEVVRFGAPYHHGLEAGSKAELMVAIASLDDPNALIICNGYKDSEFIRLGLGMRKLGYNCVFVIEAPTEVPIIIQCSQEMGVKPILGVRTKLFSKVSGHWNDTSGERSVFGLNAIQLINVIDMLKTADMIDCLQLLHYHLGSQIPNIWDIRKGVREACRYYIELVNEGAPMGYLDLGGGLAVDYDGSRSTNIHSRNYGLDEYCVDVVETIQSVLDKACIAHPTIVTESGRATVSYSSILLFNILDVTSNRPQHEAPTPTEDDPEAFKNLYETLKGLTLRNAQESFNDAIYYRDEIKELFLRGLASMRVRANTDALYYSLMIEIEKLLVDHPEAISAPEQLRHMLSDIYYGNFSLFQSLPDAWAIDHVFPIAPIHRLSEKPTNHAILADITCDSDGKIDHYPAAPGFSPTLPLHAWSEEEEYYIGVFLVGAYQETLGDLHNLFGDTHIVSIYINEDGSFDFVHEVDGDTVKSVLSYVEYEPQGLLAKFRQKAEKAVKEGVLTPKERQRIVNDFEVGLRGYTYYEK